MQFCLDQDFDFWNIWIRIVIFSYIWIRNRIVNIRIRIMILDIRIRIRIRNTAYK